MMTRIEVRSVLGAMALIASVVPAASGTIYRVDHEKSCAESCGTSSDWTDACCSLQDALKLVSSGDEIWVAAGTYYATDQTCDANTDCVGANNTCSSGSCVWQLPREQSFDLVSGVKVYGGFAGTETLLSQRVFGSNETILSGDLDGDDATGIQSCTSDGECGRAYGEFCVDGACIISGEAIGNTRNVVSAVGVGSGAQLDRFTITGGYGAWHGGGIDVTDTTTELVIRDCRIANNLAAYGGGVYVDPTSAASLVRCEITQNYASGNGDPPINDSFGGGVFAGADGGEVTSSLYVVGCKVTKNGSINKGGGLWIGGFQAVVQNTLIAKNRSGFGSAIYASKVGSIAMTSCTVAHNICATGKEAVELGAETSTSTESTIYNSVIWGNDNGSAETQIFVGSSTTLTVDYSDVQKGLGGIEVDTNGTVFWEDHAIGEHATNHNPKFAEPAAMDFRVKSFSAIIDAGNKDLLPDDDFDLDGDGYTTGKIMVDVGLRTRRVDDPAVLPNAASPNEPVDMGAYELACESLFKPTRPTTGEPSYNLNR